MVQLNKDNEAYKLEFKEPVANVSAHIFAIHCKIVWVENNKDFEKSKCSKTSKIVTLINHNTGIFTQAFKLNKLIQEVSESDGLQDNQSFMYLFDYSLRMGVSSYKAIIDYSKMFSEIAEEEEVAYEQVDKVISKLDEMKTTIGQYFVTLDSFAHIIENSNSITKDNENYGRKKIHSILEELLEVLSHKSKEHSEEIKEVKHDFNYSLESDSHIFEGPQIFIHQK